MAAVAGHDWALVPEECKAGCKLQEARQLLAAAEKLVGKTIRGETVSQALWCDQGGHAFSARDPKSEHWTREVKNDAGELVKIPWDVCGTHMSAINSRLAALEAEIGKPHDSAT